MRCTWTFCLLALLFGAVPIHAQQPPRNIVLVVADDLGLDITCYGGKVKTPHIDALAKQGVRFANAYTSVASCSPSRASLYSGLFTHQNGQYGLQHSSHKQNMHGWVQPISVLLKANGYFTGIIGKWHTGPDSLFQFDVDNSKKVNSRSPEAMADAARNFVQKRGKQPFFLIMGYTDPHRAGKGFGNQAFKDDPKETVYDPKQVDVPPHLPDNDAVRGDIADYAQSSSRFDRGVGQLIETLKQLGVYENTLIIVVSDNGMPFPGAKATLYGAGTHLPLVMAGPDVPSGRVNQGVVSYLDIVPTILDVTKSKGPSYKLPGRSLVPILNDDSGKGFDEAFGSHQFHEITMYYPMRSIATRTHKYILNLDHAKEFPLPSDLWASPSWQSVRKGNLEMMGQRSTKFFLQRPREELYDLIKDPHEMKNLSSDPASQAILTDLRGRVRTWQRDTNDPWLILYRNEDASVNK